MLVFTAIALVPLQLAIAVPSRENDMVPENATATGIVAVVEDGATVAVTVNFWSTVGEAGEMEFTVTVVAAAATVTLSVVIFPEVVAL